MAEYKGISLEEMRENYRSVLVQSKYQGMISDCVQQLMNKTSEQDLESWRLHGDYVAKEKIEKWMEKTEFWKNREEDILPNSESQRSYSKKREVIARTEETRVQEFFAKYEDVYFPDISKMTPFDKIENALEQFFDLSNMKYSIKIEDYSDLIDRICWESYSLINQTEDIKTKEEILQSIGDVKQSDVNDVTIETKQAVNARENERQGESKE